MHATRYLGHLLKINKNKVITEKIFFNFLWINHALHPQCPYMTNIPSSALEKK